ncbi:MAG: hypothetical protein WKH64_15155 [Chloroflexia bacterium]
MSSEIRRGPDARIGAGRAAPRAGRRVSGVQVEAASVEPTAWD